MRQSMQIVSFSFPIGGIQEQALHYRQKATEDQARLGRGLVFNFGIGGAQVV